MQYAKATLFNLFEFNKVMDWHVEMVQSIFVGLHDVSRRLSPKSSYRVFRPMKEMVIRRAGRSQQNADGPTLLRKLKAVVRRL